MVRIDIVRLVFNIEYVYGLMMLDQQIKYHTLELPWLNNRRSVSCVPAGIYKCVIKPLRASATSSIGEAPMLLDVPGRSGIFIHIGNSTVDSKGCILVGCGTYNYSTIVHSTKAFVELLRYVRTHQPLEVAIHDWR